MKKNIKLCGASVMALVLAVGCATPDGKGDHATSGAVAGAAIGGTAAYILCRAAKRPARECNAIAAAGLAVGGAIGWQQGKARDLAEARATEARLKRAGMAASVDTAPVRQADTQGKTVTVDAFKGITVPLDPVVPEIKSSSSTMVTAMQDLGELSVTTSEPTRVIYRVSPSEQPKIKAWMQNGISQAKSKNPSAPDPVWQELPFDKSKPQFVRVEPANQTQFSSNEVPAAS